MLSTPGVDEVQCQHRCTSRGPVHRERNMLSLCHDDWEGKGCFNFEPSTRVFWMQDGNNLLMLAAAGGHYEAIFSKKPLLMDTVWASLFSPQFFGKDVHPF